VKCGDLVRVRDIGIRSGQIAIILAETDWVDLKVYDILLGSDFLDDVDSYFLEPIGSEDEAR
jgi:hypothetical protein